MECINAKSLRGKLGQWGTQHLLPLQEIGVMGHPAFGSRAKVGNILVASPGWVPLGSGDDASR